MPFEKFTDRARRIVSLASAEAARLGDPSVDTIHLLLGMIHEANGIAGHVLAEYGIGAELVQKHYELVCDQPDVSLADVESRSLLEAQWLNHWYAGTEHLLLALCCLPTCRAFRLLEHLGKHPVQFCHYVVEILGRHDEWDRWLKEHSEAIHR